MNEDDAMNTDEPQSNEHLATTQPNVATEPPVAPSPAPIKKKFPILIAAIIAGAVALVVGGSIAAYNLYYQNPDKVVSDALMATLQAKTATYNGTIEQTTGDMTTKVTFYGQNVGSQSGELDISADISNGSMHVVAKGSGVMDADGNLYFKLENLKQVIADLASSAGSAYDTTPFNALITKIDNKWIKISASDLKGVNDALSKTQTCVADTLKSFNNDDGAKKEISTIYMKNKFLTIDKKLGSKYIADVGSLGYAITLDNVKAAAFGKALKDTKIGKQLENCGPSSTASDEDSTEVIEKSKVTADLWVSRFSHTVTMLNVSTGDKTNNTKFTVYPHFNKPVTLTKPTDTVSLKQLIDDFRSAYTDLYSAY